MKSCLLMNLHEKFVEIILHGRVGCLVFSLLYPDRFDQNRVTNQSCQIIRVCECYFYWKYRVAYNVTIQQVTNQIVLHYVCLWFHFLEQGIISRFGSCI